MGNFRKPIGLDPIRDLSRPNLQFDPEEMERVRGMLLGCNLGYSTTIDTLNSAIVPENFEGKGKLKKVSDNINKIIDRTNMTVILIFENIVAFLKAEGKNEELVAYLESLGGMRGIDDLYAKISETLWDKSILMFEDPREIEAILKAEQQQVIDALSELVAAYCRSTGYEVVPDDKTISGFKVIDSEGNVVNIYDLYAEVAEVLKQNPNLYDDKFEISYGMIEDYLLEEGLAEALEIEPEEKSLGEMIIDDLFIRPAATIGNIALNTAAAIGSGVEHIIDGAMSLAEMALMSKPATRYMLDTFPEALETVDDFVATQYVETARSAAYRTGVGQWLDDNGNPLFTSQGPGTRLLLGLGEAIPITAATIATSGVINPVVLQGLQEMGRAKERFLNTVTPREGESYGEYTTRGNNYAGTNAAWVGVENAILGGMNGFSPTGIPIVDAGIRIGANGIYNALDVPFLALTDTVYTDKEFGKAFNDVGGFGAMGTAAALGAGFSILEESRRMMSEMYGEADPKTKPQQDTDPDPNTKPQQDTDPDPNTKPQQDTDPDPKTKLQQDIDPDPKTKLQQDIDPDPKTKLQQDTDPNTKPQQDTDPKTKPLPDTDPDAPLPDAVGKLPDTDPKATLPDSDPDAPLPDAVGKLPDTDPKATLPDSNPDAPLPDAVGKLPDTDPKATLPDSDPDAPLPDAVSKLPENIQPDADPDVRIPVKIVKGPSGSQPKPENVARITSACQKSIEYLKAYYRSLGLDLDEKIINRLKGKTIEVMTDSEFKQKYGKNKKGVYDPDKNAIVLPESAETVTVAHEGNHLFGSGGKYRGVDETLNEYIAVASNPDNNNASGYKLPVQATRVCVEAMESAGIPAERILAESFTSENPDLWLNELEKVVPGAGERYKAATQIINVDGPNERASPEMIKTARSTLVDIAKEVQAATGYTYKSSDKWWAPPKPNP